MVALAGLLLLAGSGPAAAATPGTPWTWGGNSFGQLGDGTTSNRTAPVGVSGLSGCRR
jgi:alpha-tubulin suppressor-like RCC1 family protein